jgi:hypothetical protein
MCRILRWTGYASALIGALLIVMAIIGGFRFHHHYAHAHMQVCCNMQHHDGGMSLAKSDSASSKQHSMSVNSPMGKQDSVKCCKSHVMCCNASPMNRNSHQMYHYRIGFHIGLAICFLLLAITLFMISNSCRCKRCREDIEAKGEHIEEKKE